MNTKKTTWRFWLSLVILLVLVPLTVLVFSRFDRKYYLAGLAIIVLTMAAFFLHFESRKPQARDHGSKELVIRFLFLYNKYFRNAIQNNCHWKCEASVLTVRQQQSCG